MGPGAIFSNIGLIWPRLVHPHACPLPEGEGSIRVRRGGLLRRGQERQTFNSLPFASISFHSLSSTRGRWVGLRSGQEWPNFYFGCNWLHFVAFLIVRTLTLALSQRERGIFPPSRERRQPDAETTHTTNVRLTGVWRNGQLSSLGEVSGEPPCRYEVSLVWLVWQLRSALPDAHRGQHITISPKVDQSRSPFGCGLIQTRPGGS